MIVPASELVALRFGLMAHNFPPPLAMMALLVFPMSARKAAFKSRLLKTVMLTNQFPLFCHQPVL